MTTVNVLKVPGDYQLLARDGGIVLDVVSTSTIRVANTGSVTIYGNLDVIGNTTYIESTNTNITDNILFLNAGETNYYVSQGVSGIAISRGDITTTSNAATLFFNDGKSWSYDNVYSNRGVWEFGVGGFGGGIRADAIRLGPTATFLNFLGKENPNAVLNVRGTIDYENNVLDDDDIPNKKYVDTKAYLGEESTKKIQVGNSFVKINDSSIVPTDPYYSISSKIFAALTTSTNIVFKLEGTTALVQGLTINDTNIIVNGDRSSQNIKITPYNTGTVQISSALSFANIAPPNPTNNYTNVYSTSTIGGGGTGLYFVNNTRRDELVSRKRAIIYGIIF